MKAIIPLSHKQKQQLEKQAKEYARDYFQNAQHVISERLCLATILVLDDCFRDRFGETDEEIVKNYKRFALCLCNMFSDYKRDCYKWGGDWDNPRAIADAMREELKERGIEVNFE
ncbi:MAG: hypothetical protein IJX47_02385 [Clostridia bacterium]|nr:hypothetical protein [Clostridia bacterium]